VAQLPTPARSTRGRALHAALVHAQVVPHAVGHVPHPLVQRGDHAGATFAEAVPTATRSAGPRRGGARVFAKLRLVHVVGAVVPVAQGGGALHDHRRAPGSQAARRSSPDHSIVRRRSDNYTHVIRCPMGVADTVRRARSRGDSVVSPLRLAVVFGRKLGICRRCTVGTGTTDPRPCRAGSDRLRGAMLRTLAARRTDALPPGDRGSCPRPGDPHQSP
jgi:hypothetical protein